jgi:nitric oxide reductase large subunit
LKIFALPLILLVIGIGLIIWGYLLTLEKHKEENYIKDPTPESLTEVGIIYILNSIINILPLWLIKLILYVFGVSLIIISMYLFYFIIFVN